ncbi:flagellar assembly protein FliW [Microbacterium sp. 179-I 3D3 NHS]|uniref:flagellar assembly protein FliW n=1 Tax=unclassified Microbacterium TaxID=2609290 RepID=UPI0039A3E011
MTASLAFVTPPPGLAPHVDFSLAPVDGAEGLFALRAVHDEGLRLYLVDPQSVVSAYAPTLSDEQVAELALTSPDDAMVLVVAHPSSEGVSVNLLAPVVVNRRSGAAAQVILEDQDYPLRAPLG